MQEVSKASRFTSDGWSGTPCRKGKAGTLYLLRDTMPSKRHRFGDARCVENSTKLVVVGGYLGMRMGVGSGCDWNLEFGSCSKDRAVWILFADGLAPTSRARFDGETCFPCDLENRAKPSRGIVTIG